MGQAITDYVKFLVDARDTVCRLSCDQNTAGQLAGEEEMKKREPETVRKVVSDSVNQMIKKRLDEINSSYDQELGKGQERLRKARVKRKGAKSQEAKEWIAEETSELRKHNRDLKAQMRTSSQKNRVSAWCEAMFHYALYYPRDFREIVVFLLILVICFLGISCGIYFLISQRVIWYLAAVYFVDAFLFSGLHVMIDNKTRPRHQDTPKRGRDVCNHLRVSQEKIKVITRTIQKDGSGDLHNLEKCDDKIAYVEQELSEIASRKKDALSTPENVTKAIISDEIMTNHKDKLDRLRQELGEVPVNLCNLESSVRERNIRITDIYDPYLRRGPLQLEKLAQLPRIIQTDSVSNITEAIKIYQDTGQDTGRP